MTTTSTMGTTAKIGNTIRLAIYLRYSCDQQRTTSIDDQLRNCQDFAARKGFSTENVQIFSDEALSGTFKHEHKREGYQALMKAWNDGKFDVLICDEFSRLTRDIVEQAKLVRRLENNHRVRLLTVNGLDTSQPNWQLQVGLIGLVGQQSVRDMQHRVERGMVGQLERGFSIAVPPFGYRLQREFDSNGNRIGSLWLVEENNAAIVREIYRRRENGESMHQIARWLNESGIPPRRQPKGHAGYWRPAAIKNLLANRIYRGEFVWNGSTTVKARAKKTGEEIVPQTFLRPELRLVSDQTWHRCNSNSVSRSNYGGGRHVLAGLLTCGACGATLVISSASRCRSAYCATCTSVQAALGSIRHQPDESELIDAEPAPNDKRQTVTVATVAIQLLLTEALESFLTPSFTEAFRQSLRDKLAGNNERELQTCREELSKLLRSQERLSKMLAAADEDDPMLMERYQETKCMARTAQDRLQELEAGSARIDHKAIAAQLQVNPASLLPSLFDNTLPPERVRATLARLFPRIVLEGKDGRYTSHWRICFAPGAALAEASRTEVVSDEAVEMRFVVRYRPDNRSDNPGNRWSVSPLE